MPELIVSTDENQSALTVQQSTRTTNCHAVSVTQGATSGRGRGLSVVSENPASPAVMVRAPGQLLDLRNSDNATVLSLSQAGALVTARDNDRPPAYPSEQNLKIWTGDPNDAGHVTAQSNAGVAGRITLVRMTVRQRMTWTKIWYGLSGVDAGGAIANSFLGVYDVNGALLGQTADISAPLSANATAKADPLVTPFTTDPGFYYIALLLNGTWTTNSFTFKATGAGVTVNAGLVAPNLRYANLLTGQTSLPASITMANQVTTIINTGWGSQWYGVE